MDPVHEFLNERLKGFKKLAVLGAGSTLRADDAAGVLVTEKLREAFDPAEYPELLFCVGETAPENFSGKIRNFCPTHLLIIDAADIGLEAGCIEEIRPEDVGGPTYCTHMLPLRVMISYLVRETGCDVTLLGIQHKSLEFDGEMTPEVLAAVEKLTGAVRGVVSKKALGDRDGIA